MKHFFAILMIVIFSSLGYPGSKEIPNLEQATFHIYTAGQPTEKGFFELKKMGVQTIVNVLPEEEQLVGEPQRVAHYQMSYLTLPFDPSHVSRQTVERFAMMLHVQQGHTILIHCSTANHVGGLWFAYRVLMEDAPLGIALKEGRKIGMKPWLEDLLFNWVVEEKERMEIDFEERAS
jgi:protein tyrosine phosphatase (PTP) superfamily phosphohydrolase (DUF442 family)